MIRHGSASWMTARRLRAHGVILGVCLWSVYIWNMSAPGFLDRAHNLKGTDFLHFYTIGSLARACDGGDLYNVEIQSQLAEQRVPAAHGIKYLPLYPPQVSMLFAPFAHLSYPWALAGWLSVSFIVYGVCCYGVWLACPKLRDYPITILILALAFPPFWHLTAWGQTSALALACFTLAYFSFRADREFMAGLALGCIIFKPQLGLAAAIIFLATFRWRVISGALVAATAQIAMAWFYYGANPLREWVRTLLLAPSRMALFEPRIYQTHCLRTFWIMLVPWASASVALYLISALVVIGMTIACWRSRMALSLRFSSLLLASVLIAPHLTVYDLVILAPAFLLLSDWVVPASQRGSSRVKLLLYCAYAAPLLGPFARWTHFQLSVLVMAVLLFEIWKLGRNPVSLER